MKNPNPTDPNPTDPNPLDETPNASFTWPDGKTLALSVVLNVEEGSEMSVAQGDKKPEPVDELGVAVSVPIRNFVNESNYLYGVRAGAPRILRVLARHQVHATVTAAAQALERAPALTKRLLAGNHEIAAHGWRWVHQFSLDEEKERAFITRATESIKASTGTAPVGWLSRYLHTPHTRRILSDLGYAYHMDDLSDDLPRWEQVERTDGSTRPLVCMPYALDTNDMKFWTDPGYSPQDWLDYNRRTFDWLYEESQSLGPRMMSLGLHLRIMGRPGRIWALDEFLSHVGARDGIWIAPRREIARRFATQVPWRG
ncbi:MAG: polysaccharide deacetylase family protein [Pseudomonadota bacterium]